MVNDVTIIATIIAIFILVGTVLPFIHDSFGVSSTETDCFTKGIDSLVGGLTNSTEQMGEKSSVVVVASIGSLGFFDVVKSVIGMFFWTCGALPLFIDLFFLILRITLLLLLVRLIRSGGG